MTACELAAFVGNTIVIFNEDVNRLEYKVEKINETSFIITMNDGKKFYVEISKIIETIIY